MSNLSEFKKEFDFKTRKSESTRIKDKYKDRIPIIVEKSSNSDIANIDKKKYLVPNDITVGQFVYIIRKRIDLTSEKAIFLFTENKTIPPTSSVITEIYEQYKNDDGFLYLIYAGENTFG
tara:strand:- start:854 stop:1213 length:360 start_codon:yes stop_codon:yes gene_type:complete